MKLSKVFVDSYLPVAHNSESQSRVFLDGACKLSLDGDVIYCRNGESGKIVWCIPVTRAIYFVPQEEVLNAKPAKLDPKS